MEAMFSGQKWKRAGLLPDDDDYNSASAEDNQLLASKVVAVEIAGHLEGTDASRVSRAHANSFE